jgi:16S rRNA (cytosine967-C5)-methyltransferase
MRMGIYQMRFLSRIPAHAAVMESVEQAMRMSKRAAAGLMNAVLRKVHKKELAWPDEATEAGMPEWLWEKWKREMGEDRAWAAAEAGLTPAGKQTRGTGAGAVRMDDGAQKIVPLLKLKAEMRLLDVCAAPGNKTRQAMETTKNVIACDRSFPRLAGLRRLRVPLVQLDAAKPLPFRPVFDRVLADVPCSGTGTLGRNPEIKWRLTPEELIRQRDRQRSILYEALRALKPGGRVVYATCSLEKEENEEVVAATPGIRVIEELRIYPGQAGTDGFYAAAIERAE